jgi:exodeoxyribonuclease-1
MSFVLYDLETTGLRKRYDQVIQFAAVQTDADLNIIDRFYTRCRLLPHVIPSPEALCVTGLRIEQLLDPSLPSHFEMVSRIRAVRRVGALPSFSASTPSPSMRNSCAKPFTSAFSARTSRTRKAAPELMCLISAGLPPRSGRVS